MRRSALVVGAGIVGAAIADGLLATGCAVTLFEADLPAGGATAAAMGHLVVLDDSPEQMGFTGRGLALWRREDLPAGCEREARGTVWVARDAEEMEEARAKAGRYAAMGLEAELLDPDRLRAAEPALRGGLAGGLLVTGDQVLYPVAGARFLLDRALGRGAVLKRERVRFLEPGGLRTDTGLFKADAVILAAGLGCTQLLPALAVTPRKGHLAITGRVPGLVRHQLVELGYLKSAHGRDGASVAFNVQPRATGQLLIGSSREFAGLDPAPNRELLGRMLRKAADYLPGLVQVPVLRVWTGFRPCGPGNLPVIGPWPGQEGLYVAAGHEGLGITTALVTAELIVHHVLGAPSALDPAPFLPAAGHG
jgi:glycine/D-amino acid oxidase-like deaminating enzyme